MHILFFSHYFPPEGNAPATRVHSLARRWVAAGHKVTVITSAPNVPDGIVYEGYKNKLWQKEEVDGINVIRVWTYLAPNKGALKRILNYVTYMFSALFFSFFVRGVDQIISTSPQFFCGWAGVLAAKFRFKKNVLEIRDIWPDSIVAVGAMKESKMIQIFEWLEIKMYKWSTHIVTVGNGYKRKLLEKGVPEEKLSVITNGLDVDDYEPMAKDQDLIKKYNLEGKFVCSYTGTVGMACALDVMIRAAEKLKAMGEDSIHLLIVGDGAVRADLEREAKQKGLADYLSFAGRQPKKMMPNFLSITDVCLAHLRKTDLFSTVLPSKIFEAAGMAKPMIMGVDGDAREIIEKAGAGFFMEPENEDDLIAHLLKMSKDTLLCEKLGKSGQDYITKHFDRAVLSEDYLDILEKI